MTQATHLPKNNNNAPTDSLEAPRGILKGVYCTVCEVFHIPPACIPWKEEY